MNLIQKLKNIQFETKNDRFYKNTGIYNEVMYLIHCVNLSFARCQTEGGTKLISTKNKETIFASEAFAYVSGESSIYIECTVLVCLAADITSECSLCLKNNRKRREIAIGDQSTERTTIIKSPVFYIIDKGN